MAANEHAIVWELLPVYALGGLEAAEASGVRRHVAGCPECRDELSVYERLADALALAAPEVAPSAALRGRLLTAVGGPAQGSRGAGVQGREETTEVDRSPLLPRSPAPLRRKRLAIYAILTLAAIILGGLLWAAVGLWAVDSSAISLAPSDVAPDAGGWLRFDGGGATLEVDGLPVLPPEQQYQLWAVRDEERASGAVFSVNDRGWAEVAVALEYPAAEYNRFGITIEPVGGSPGPTGERVLGWRRE